MKRTALKRNTPLVRTKFTFNGYRSKFKPKPFLEVKFRVRKRSSKLPKPRIWSTRTADYKFSLHIRKRDGRCMFPGCDVTDIKILQCSHYHGRAHSSTRYADENCIALCWLHHFKDKLLGYEYQKQREEVHGYDGQYTIFMKEWLGIKGFKRLDELHRKVVSRSTEIMRLMARLSTPPFS